VRCDLDKRFETVERTALKPYKCFVCEGEIELGEVYTEVVRNSNPLHPRKAYYSTIRVCLHHDLNRLELE
tara:strand:+ start:52123 stop:52332 length:210 start_codon:yes stop_codon:yes gene_type:complete